MLDHSKRWLRVLLVADWLLVAVAVPAAFLIEPTLPPAVREFVAAQDELPLGLRELLQLAAMSLSLLLWLVGSVGAFFLWPPARPLYLASVLTTVAFTPFVGLSILAPLVSALDAATLVISGLVLGLLYFSSLRDRFEPALQRAPGAS